MKIVHDRFKIRSLKKSDAEGLAKQGNDKEVWRNLRDKFPHPYTIEDGENFIRFIQNQPRELSFAIEVEGKFAGIIGFNQQEDVYRKSLEIGYWLGESYSGQGIMTEAVKSMCKYAFENFDINRLHTGVYGWNPASVRVLEKAGFKKEGVHRQAVYKDDQFTDEHRYALLKSELNLD